MTETGYTLAIGDRAYSSWSLRGWLLFHAFGLPVATRQGRLYTDDFPRLMAEFAPARTAPALRLPEGGVMFESIAIAEELASRHPAAGHWPQDPTARAVARTLTAEMHAGFTQIRTYCPMNLRVSYQDCAPPPELLSELDRLREIWTWARQTLGHGGVWLCGDYSVADAFFAPLVSRIATYNLPIGAVDQPYIDAHLAHPSFRMWRAMGMVDGADQPFYARDYPIRDWPGPQPIPASRAEFGPSVNAHCPYSQKPVTHFAEIEGKIWGFCNAFCRDKTVADPEAWPAFMALLRAARDAAPMRP